MGVKTVIQSRRSPLRPFLTAKSRKLALRIDEPQPILPIRITHIAAQIDSAGEQGSNLGFANRTAHHFAFKDQFSDKWKTRSALRRAQFFCMRFCLRRYARESSRRKESQNQTQHPKFHNRSPRY